MHYLAAGEVREARVRGEAILSAGAVNTLQLLMLSRIGPADQLAAHGIEVVVNSPEVGVNLQDHPVCTPMWHSPNMRNVWEDAKPHNILRYLLLRNGPLSSNGGDGAAFARSRDGLPAPELRVRGITGLRVVDASVMPTIPHGPPNAPIIALAERASDLIRGNTPLAPASPERPPRNPAPCID